MGFFVYLTKTTSCASGSEKLLAMYQKKSPKSVILDKVSRPLTNILKEDP